MSGLAGNFPQPGMTPDQLRRLADQIEARSCTGITASWCPVHGDCCCPDPEQERCSHDCPLHSPVSPHGEATS